eukprot:TRINITY_DN11490_c0_g1_i2.p2 TRINITY_DN11490_c0_g1~~TRINITY_DN11490_c0_g1_i2.p2  ORF type:complete len:232 (+),score=40.73 TRINITY_DN11490_c0_g1_i2:2212-2907(+)
MVAHHHRVINPGDPIPQLPPTSAYKHAGTRVCFAQALDHVRGAAAVGMTGRYLYKAFTGLSAKDAVIDTVQRVVAFEATARAARATFGVDLDGVDEPHTINHYGQYVQRALEVKQQQQHAEAARQRNWGLGSAYRSLSQNCRALWRLATARDDRAGQVEVGMAMAALVYVASPWDLIPDGTPLVGYVDDIHVVRYALKTINNRINRYRGNVDRDAAAAAGRARIVAAAMAV